MALLDDLSRWPRERLVRLLTVRPDLRAAKDLRELARLASSPGSTHTAIGDLPAAQRAVLEAVVLLREDATQDDLLSLDPDANPSTVLAVLADLRDRLLVSDRGLRPVGMVRQYLPSPLGLGRPIEQVHEHTPLYELDRLLALYGEKAPRSKAAARQLLAAVLSDTEALAASFDHLPPEQLAVLRRYDSDGPVLREPGLNVWEERPPTDPAARRLLSVGLLAVTPSGTVELPREVGLALRFPVVTRFPLEAPAGGRAVVDAELLGAAAAAVRELLERCDAVLDRLGARPVPLLASGGIGVRELRTLAKDVGGEAADVSTLLSLLRGIGAVATTTKDARVTSSARAWTASDDGMRWSGLVRAWLALNDAPASGRRLTAALSFGAYDARARPGRERLLQLLDTNPGVSCTTDEWLERWHARWPESRRTSHDRAGTAAEREVRGDVLAEAVRLGLLVDGASTPLLGPLLDGGDVEAALAAAAGAGETRVLAQADLTLVCPGRPARELKVALDRLAAVESTGQATVWRLSESSLTRAYDEGDTPDDVLALLQRWAGELPQPMAYLVRDAHRRHGRARVGTATSYVVVDDDGLLVTALASKGAAGKALTTLAVRRIAAGVAVSRGSVEATVAALRSAGVPAVAEAAQGAKGVAAGVARRAPAAAPRLAPLPGSPRRSADVEADVDRLLSS